jgi:hypothetical protein|uniref:Thioredoxin domain-containing protein n=1 Tax=viral metagenome TaxID=1070528 RepID=A0A6C0E8F6_9ZZZZ
MEDEKYTQDKLIEFLNDGHKIGHHCFVLIYLVGCGPCNMTKPEWKKVANSFGYRNDNQGVVMVDVDQDNLDQIRPAIGNYPISGFPTMLHVHRDMKTSSYEDSNVKNKNRSAESFREWINHYVNMIGVGNSKPESNMEKLHRPLLSMSISTRSRGKNSSSKHSKKHKHRDSLTGGKWTLKYKKSINCKRPKGFSQRQHCKYGRKNSRLFSIRRRNTRK